MKGVQSSVSLGRNLEGDSDFGSLAHAHAQAQLRNGNHSGPSIEDLSRSFYTIGGAHTLWG